MKKLIWLEIKKCFGQKKVWIILMLLICMKVFISLNDNAPYPSSIDVSIYKDYISRIEGPHNADKLEYINSEIARYDELRHNKDLYIAKYRQGEITPTEFRTIINEIDKADITISTLYNIQAKGNYYNSMYPKGVYFYDLDINRYLTELDIDYSALIFVLFITSLLFVTDYQSKTYVLVKSSKYGGKTLLNIRLGILVASTVIISTLFQIIEFVIKYNTLELVALDKPIKSIILFMNCAMDVSIYEMFGVMFVTRLVFLVFISIMSVMISYIAKNAMGIIAAGLMIVVIPEFILHTLPKWLYFILPAGGYNGVTIYNPMEKIMGLPGNIYAWLCGIIISILAITFMEYTESQALG